MVVKNQIKLIKSLQQKKYRTRHGLFVVEGVKTVVELLKSEIILHHVYATDGISLDVDQAKFEIVSEKELRQMSSLKNPNGVLGVFEIPESRPIEFTDWVVVLDDIRDPGNLGTIIRLCDWFGIEHLLCSENTVDCYNPKVLQATMGSISRVNLVYGDLKGVIENSEVPVFGSFMDASPVYNVELPEVAILVMGNEANGISKTIKEFCDGKIGIPQFGRSTTESLNVATATAILLNEIRRE